MPLIAAPLVPHARRLDGLGILVHYPRIVLQGSGYGVHVHLHHQMSEYHLNVGRRHPHPRQHQDQCDV